LLVVFSLFKDLFSISSVPSFSSSLRCFYNSCFLECPLFSLIQSIKLSYALLSFPGLPLSPSPFMPHSLRLSFSGGCDLFFPHLRFFVLCFNSPALSNSKLLIWPPFLVLMSFLLFKVLEFIRGLNEIGHSLEPDFFYSSPSASSFGRYRSMRLVLTRFPPLCPPSAPCVEGDPTGAPSLLHF